MPCPSFAGTSNNFLFDTIQAELDTYLARPETRFLPDWVVLGSLELSMLRALVRDLPCLRREDLHAATRCRVSCGSGQKMEPAAARPPRPRSRRHRPALRQGRLLTAQIPRRLPGLRPRLRHRAETAQGREAVAVHGSRPDSGRPAFGRAIPRPGRARRSLCERLAAGYDAAEHPVPRRFEGRAESIDRDNKRGLADDPGGLRRCRAHGHDGPGADPRWGSSPSRKRCPCAFTPPVAGHPRVSRNLGRWRTVG